MKIDKYAELWTDRFGRYVLVHFPGRPSHDLLPFDTVDRSAVLIDDDDLNGAVVARMIEAGVTVHEGLPE